MKTILIIFLIILIIFLILWLGLQITPNPLPAYGVQTITPETIPLPKGLPAPVELFYRKVYGERVPVITSAVISGRAKLTIPAGKGITFPSRFRFSHIAGKGYRHYIETTFYGFPIMKVNEHFLDGKGRLDLPFGIFDGEKVDQGATLALWGESVWLPAIWITDERIRWEAVDDVTAILIIPYLSEQERFIVRFDPVSGMLRFMEAMRYRDSDANAPKILWIAESKAWKEVNGYLLPTICEVTWFDNGSPWAVFKVEEVVYNLGIETNIRADVPIIFVL